MIDPLLMRQAVGTARQAKIMVAGEHEDVLWLTFALGTDVDCFFHTKLFVLFQLKISEIMK